MCYFYHKNFVEKVGDFVWKTASGKFLAALPRHYSLWYNDGMKQGMKRFLKRIMGRPDLKYSTEDYGRATGALGDFVKFHEKYLLNQHHLPARKDRAPYNAEIAKMEPIYNFFSSDLEANNPTVKPVFEYDNFHSGTPMAYKPFPGSLREVKKTLRHKNLYWYPRSAGGFYAQQKIVDYLIREGFRADKIELPDGEMYGGLGINNVVFACSTTHAYSLIMSAVAQPGDVILMSAPNYGLFAIMTELDNYRTEVINLREEDGWQINPVLLAEKIDALNKELATGVKKGERVPKVAAFLNLNPHNPTGKVLNHKNLQILKDVGQVCKERGVFAIDDLVYRDLTYDLDDLAVPLASFPEYFNNTISLFGLSKAYGLASFRAAVIVAPAAVTDVLAQRIHDTMDSMPVLQTAAVAGAFNGSNRRYRQHRRYMGALIREYKFRYYLTFALAYGVNRISDARLRGRIERVIRKYEKSAEGRALLLKGCPGLKIRKGTEPDSGFFTVFDFTGLKGKTTPDGVVISTEQELLDYFYKGSGLSYLMGGNFCWPVEGEFVGRISFGISRKAMVRNMKALNEMIRRLK